MQEREQELPAGVTPGTEVVVGGVRYTVERLVRDEHGQWADCVAELEGGGLRFRSFPA
jgi:hypothetical protein